MNINNLTYKGNLNYKNNLNYKDNLNCNNSNLILNSKSIIINSNNNLTPHPNPLPVRRFAPLALCQTTSYRNCASTFRFGFVLQGAREQLTTFAKFNCNSIFNFQSSIFNFSKSAFSLIELSIVLIIIGLLIAGVTGGASLIQSAKVRSLINEIKDYERAVYTFQAARGRYPGDVKNYGTFGYYSNYYEPTSTSNYYARPGYTYKESDFPSEFITEFQKTAGNGVIPNHKSAPFVELYNEGIIDFRPLSNTDSTSSKNAKLGVPFSKNHAPASFHFTHTDTSYSGMNGKPCTMGDKNCDFDKGIAHNGQLKKAIVLNSYPSAKLDPKLLKAVDEKVDDGWFNTGTFRSGCFGINTTSYWRNSYENAIDGNKKCMYVFYAI